MVNPCMSSADGGSGKLHRLWMHMYKVIFGQRSWSC